MPAATLKINIIADATQAAATMDKASTRAGKFGSGLKKAALPAGALLAGLGLMGKAAADDARGQAILARQLQKSAGATQAQVAASEAWISQTAMATGVADDQLRPALGALARATGDVGKSQGAMGVALDVAAATGKDVTTVAAALAKGYAGNTGAIGKLVPGLDKAVVKSGDMQKIMDELARTTGGTAAAAADTAAGKMQRAALAMDEAKEAAGAALLPALGALAGVLSRVVGFAQQHETAMKIAVIVVGSLAAAVFALNAIMAVSSAVTTISGYATKTYAGETKLAAAASKAWAAVQWVLNAALSANPIGIIIIAVIALVAAVVLAYKKSETFRRVVNAVWAGIKTAIGAAWNWLKSNVFAPFAAVYRVASAAAGTAVAAIGKAWDGLKAALKSVWDWIKSNIIDPMSTAFDKIGDAIKWVIDKIKSIRIPGPVQKLIDLGKGLFAVPAPAAPAPAPRVAATRRGRATAPAGGGRRSRDGDALVVNVVLDGKRVGGYVDRLISRRLDIEGARAAAGSWA